MAKKRAVERLVIGPGDDLWPTQLNDLDSPPEQLHLHGDPGLLRDASELVTITGARASTGYGNLMAQNLASDVTNRGQSVVTGGAYGSDIRAVRAALSADGPGPIVVLVSGLNVLHPYGNQDWLHTAATCGGLLVSEHEDDARPAHRSFLTRARILAALSAQTVIVEAAIRSSARLVVRSARTMGRDVFAIPGPVTSATSSGTNAMIASGEARLITGAHDVPYIDTSEETDS